MKMEMKSIKVKLSDLTHMELKMTAVKNKTTMNDLIVGLIEKFLAEGKTTGILIRSPMTKEKMSEGVNQILDVFK